MQNLLRKTRTNSWFHAAVFFWPALILVPVICAEFYVDYFAPGGRETEVFLVQISIILGLIYWLLVCICGLHLLSFLWDRKCLGESDRRYLFYNAYPWCLILLMSFMAGDLLWFFRVPGWLLTDFWNPFIR